jgi:hypothetical protein
LNKNLVAFIVAPIFIGMAFVDKARANSISTEEFLGEYQGVSVKDPGKNWLPADLNVSIQPHDNGFIMRWVTVTSGISGITERQKNTVKFHPTKRTSVFAAAMKPNLFGGWEPLDPFNGDPFMWARYLDSTLTIYAMIITDSGAHDMQIYERTLTPEGFIIKIKRMRNESPLQIVNGIVKRKK